MKSAVQWFNDEVSIHLDFDQRLYLKELLLQAKEMEKQQIILSYHEGSEDLNYNPQEYYTSTYGSKGNDECQFEPTTNTSSATICKHCGREKFLHQ
tara:strand:+ start:1321 stop:1608 length:288 start_codon:yes stop_codon:yes gene_type:complete